jgi:O-antigen ligase
MTRHSTTKTADIDDDRPSSRVNSAIFAIVCFIPVFATIVFGAVDNITWTLIVIFITILVGLWVTNAARTGSFEIALNSLQLPFAALILLGLLQLLPLAADTTAGILSLPATHALSLDPYATRFIVRNLIVFLIFLTAALTFVDSERRIRKLVLLTVIFGGAMAFLGILQRIANAEAIYGLRIPFQANPFGPFVNEHHFAGFMEMTAGLTLGLLFGDINRQKKFLFGIGLVVMIAAILMTSSRGGLISLVATFAVAGILSFVHRRKGGLTGEKRKIRPAVLAGAAGVAAISVLLVLLLGGDESLTRGLGLTEVGTDLSNGRTHFWAVAWQIFLAHPFVGAGLDSFGVAFTRYDTWNGLFRVERAHNDYLQILAEGGLAGFACIAGFIFLFFRRALGNIASAGDGVRRDAAIGAVAGCVGVLIHSFVDFPLRTWSNSFFFLLLVAVAVVRVPTDKPRSSKTRRRSTSL